jgi:hypothetical protein
MKKRVIALSVLAALGGIASTASAQTATYYSYNADGVGHNLIVPYFNTQGGNTTAINIVNTDTVNGKAVKVRFRGASNSDDLLDFQVYLSPGDVWAAGISTNASTGLPVLVTADNSCTQPSTVGKGTGTSFLTARLNQALTGDALANEAREGYIEILNMADVAAGSALWTAIKHNSAGVPPCTSSILDNLTSTSSGLTLPSTGLFGNWFILNVPQTTTWSGDAYALEGRITLSNFPAGLGKNVFWPQTGTPLTATDITAYTADPLMRKGLLAGAYYDLPDLSTPYLTTTTTPQQQANYLSYSLAARAVAAEYLSTAGLNATTDWVVSMPTRRYYAAVDYVAAKTPIITNFDDNADTTAIYYRRTTGTGNIAQGDSANGCKTYQIATRTDGLSFWDREEQSAVSNNIIVSPGTPMQLISLCGEVSTLGINGASPLQSTVAWKSVSTGLTKKEGWGMLTMNNMYNGTSLGLPMVVQEFVKAVNPAVSAGVSGTFGARWSGRVVARGSLYTE